MKKKIDKTLQEIGYFLRKKRIQNGVKIYFINSKVVDKIESGGNVHINTFIQYCRTAGIEFFGIVNKPDPVIELGKILKMRSLAIIQNKRFTLTIPINFYEKPF